MSHLTDINWVLVMGVSGSGKSTVGMALAEALGWDFYDADDFHPPANVSKMAQGIALDDRDRAPWLAALNAHIHDCVRRGRRIVLACSALKQTYRDQLLEGNPGIFIVYLKGDYDTIAARLQTRRGHYMSPDLLASQFEALEEPQGDLLVPVDRPVDRLIRDILAATMSGK
ncbi:MAG: gluconokinase [Anaerolineales bacterium]|nr:gluconokinase [Anaerolineales bacterium]